MEQVLEVILYIVFIVCALILTLLVLFRQGESSGDLGGAFGGMGGDTAFGVKTAQLIDKIIVWVSVLFILAAVCLTSLKNHQKGDDGQDDDDDTVQAIPTMPVDADLDRLA